MLHDVLLDPVYLIYKRLPADIPEPWIIPPFPDNRAHDVGKDQWIKEFREHINLHIGQEKAEEYFSRVAYL
jgi:hypothetical protein